MSILRRQTNRRRAFTLIEVMFALAIIVLLAGSIYAIVSAAVTATAELEARSNRARQINGFLELCRKSFHCCPSTAAFEARLQKQADLNLPELVFHNARGLFRWGNINTSFNTTILAVRPKIGGMLEMAILQDTNKAITSYLNGGTSKRPWLVLISDLRAADWRFFDTRTNLWTGSWKEPGIRPAFAELTITTEEGTGKYTFWIPPVQPL